ncbi:hypothetical protein MIMGU_mgv1a0189652mg, partial [Erythranthe guttata]
AKAKSQKKVEAKGHH